MKVFKIVGAIFAVIGIAALVGLVLSIMHTSGFIAESVTADGQIVDIVARTSRDSDGNRTTSHYPVIRFQSQDGNTIEFKASSSVSRGTGVGEAVEVRYLPRKPSKAKMWNSFMDMWGLSVFLGIFGVVFTGLGVPFFWLGIRDDLNEKRAQTYSKEIQATINGVTQNTSVTVNGRSPFQIEAQWLNPDSNEMHVFKSKNLWYDPSQLLQETITVKADPHNLKKYWMDVSFLPKKA